MSSLRTIVPSALLACALLGGTAAAQTNFARDQWFPEVRLQTIALSGDIAPGVGTPFADFDTPFGYPDTTAPWLDEQGNAGVFAHVVDPLDPSKTTSGQWTWNAATASLELVALRGDPAPGTGELFVAFPHPLFEHAPDLDAGIVGVRASTTTIPGAAFSDRSGVLELIVRHGQPLPGGPAGKSFQNPSSVFFADGSVLVPSSWSNSSNDEGFWRDRRGTLQLITRGGLQAPGMPTGVYFDKGGSLHLLGPFDHWEADAEGHIAFNGIVAGPGIGLTNDEGIWIETSDGVLELVLREGDPAPMGQSGYRFGIKLGVRAFGGSDNMPLRFSDAGTVFFGAQVNGQGSDYIQSLWMRKATGELLLVADSPAGSGSHAGMLAPGTGEPFMGRFMRGTVNAHDRLAFQDGISHPLNTLYNTETAIFWGEPGNLALLIATETWIPGLHPGELINGLVLGELHDDGSLFASANLKGGPDGTVRALLHFDASGKPTVLTREGQVVDVHGDGSDLRVVEEFGFSASDHGPQFGLRLVFTDGTAGLFRLDPVP